MAGLFLSRKICRADIVALLVVGGILSIAPWHVSFAVTHDKDKTPPVISELRAESITDNSSVVLWTTDEPADSDIKYGVNPRTNINGPNDSTLVLSHAIALSGLAAETAYAFCVQSRDEANNKAEACDIFTTTAVAPPGAGSGARPTYASVSGFAYPGARVIVSLRALPFGAVFEKETVALDDAPFSASFDKFLQGFYVFTIRAVDRNNASSARKGFWFDFTGGDAPLQKDQILIPPTLTLARSVVAWNNDIVVFGNTVPNTGVLVEVGGVSYEAKSDNSGAYEARISTARLAPGKITVRARSAMISGSGHDYSLSKTATLSLAAIPEADLNADGAVNITDFSIFIANPTDMNGDGAVNSSDVSIFLRAFAGMNY